MQQLRNDSGMVVCGGSKEGSPPGLGILQFQSYMQEEEFTFLMEFTFLLLLLDVLSLAPPPTENMGICVLGLNYDVLPKEHGQGVGDKCHLTTGDSISSILEKNLHQNSVQ